MIALGYRKLESSIKFAKVQRMERGDVEKDLQMLGLIVMENRCEP